MSTTVIHGLNIILRIASLKEDAKDLIVDFLQRVFGKDLTGFTLEVVRVTSVEPGVRVSPISQSWLKIKFSSERNEGYDAHLTHTEFSAEEIREKIVRCAGNKIKKSLIQKSDIPRLQRRLEDVDPEDVPQVNSREVHEHEISVQPSAELSTEIGEEVLLLCLLALHKEYGENTFTTDQFDRALLTDDPNCQVVEVSSKIGSLQWVEESVGGPYPMQISAIGIKKLQDAGLIEGFEAKIPQQVQSPQKDISSAKGLNLGDILAELSRLRKVAEGAQSASRELSDITSKLGSVKGTLADVQLQLKKLTERQEALLVQQLELEAKKTELLAQTEDPQIKSDLEMLKQIEDLFPRR